MTSTSATGVAAARPGIRGWPIWELPARLLWPILCVELTTVLLVAAALLAQPLLSTQDVVAMAVIGGLGVVHTELSRSIERVRWRITGDLHVDLTSVWTFAVAVLVPTGYAAVLAVALHSYQRVRSERVRSPLHRRLFSTATVVLACLASAAVMQHVRLTLPVVDRPTAALLAEALGVLVYITVNSALIAGAIAVSTGGGSAADLLGEWDENLIEIAALTLGAIVATVLPINPWLVVFVVPPLLVVQRAALVRHLQQVASLDAKTGLLNAGAWHSRAERELAKARPGQLHAVLVLDLDHFKDVNDRHGHLTGDRVLAAVAGALRREVREEDLLGRFGGEEFVVLLAGQSGGTAADLEVVAERLRARVAKLRVEVPTPDGPLTIAGFTVSVGGAICEQDAELTTLLEAADLALYEAKRNGRDQVRMGGETEWRASFSTAASTSAPSAGSPGPGGAEPVEQAGAQVAVQVALETPSGD